MYVQFKPECTFFSQFSVPLNLMKSVVSTTAVVDTLQIQHSRNTVLEQLH